MTKIEVNDTAFQINGNTLKFPIEIQLLKNILGECRLTKTKYNQIYTWDNEGVMAFSQNGELAESLLIDLINNKYKYSPLTAFNREIAFNDEDAINYYTNNKKKRVKLFSGDESGAIVTGGISLWFDVNDGKIEAIEIKSYVSKEVDKDTPSSLPIDKQYQYLESLWKEWISNIEKIVPSDNSYFNLTKGIGQNDLDMYAKLEDGITVPEELINFYKIQNVDYNPVTSAFSFSVNGWEYDLISFKDIAGERSAIMDLQGEWEALDDSISEKLHIDNYTNPKWIPFATGRNGDYLLYDTDPTNKGSYGQIIELQNESWQRNVVAGSLSDLLQHEINLLKSGQTGKYNFILSKD